MISEAHAHGSAMLYGQFIETTSKMFKEEGSAMQASLKQFVDWKMTQSLYLI